MWPTSGPTELALSLDPVSKMAPQSQEAWNKNCSLE